eukprot:TRINITY_DN8658_c0_g1_i1.p1 TRINITY_DN8658_c0_g1~~TRINITY_DN8658_c0_g1_i1.p1  ORF type:complete len:501 (+),score=113.65 TRINITY_DN8658_c0_g1_i1:146-1648(+)
MTSELISDLNKLKISQVKAAIEELATERPDIVEPLHTIVTKLLSSSNALGSTLKSAPAKRPADNATSVKSASGAKRISVVASGSPTDKEAIVVLSGKETWQQVLELISQRMKYSGAVTKLFTEAGQEILDFDGLETGGHYIALVQGQKLRLGVTNAHSAAAPPLTPRSAAPATPRGNAAPPTPRPAPSAMPPPATKPAKPATTSAAASGSAANSPAKTAKLKAANGEDAADAKPKPKPAVPKKAAKSTDAASTGVASGDQAAEPADGSVTPRNTAKPKLKSTKSSAGLVSSSSAKDVSNVPKYELSGTPRFGETVMATAVYQTAYETLQHIIKHVPYQEPDKQLVEFTGFLRFQWVPPVITTLVCDAFQAVQEKYKILGKAKGSAPASLARALRDHHKDDPDNVELTLALFAACGFTVDLPGSKRAAASPTTPRQLAPSGSGHRKAPAAAPAATPPPKPVEPSTTDAPAETVETAVTAETSAPVAAADEPASAAPAHEEF